jgi:hypothetical protein
MIGRVVINNSDIKQISILAVPLAQATGRRPVTAKVRVRFQASIFWICGKKMWHLKKLSFRLRNSINASYTYFTHPLRRYTILATEGVVKRNTASPSHANFSHHWE